jgi:hypothetical protein
LEIRDLGLPVRDAHGLETAQHIGAPLIAEPFADSKSLHAAGVSFAGFFVGDTRLGCDPSSGGAGTITVVDVAVDGRAGTPGTAIFFRNGSRDERVSGGVFHSHGCSGRPVGFARIGVASCGEAV